MMNNNVRFKNIKSRRDINFGQHLVKQEPTITIQKENSEEIRYQKQGSV